jgi:hypothetical protein
MSIFSSPPKISFLNNSIELFGKKGKEIYNVYSVYFFRCEPIDGRCIHKINLNLNYIYHFTDDLELCIEKNPFVIDKVPYEELVSKGYIPFFRSWNQILITPLYEKNKDNPCKLVKIPMIVDKNEKC